MTIPEIILLCVLAAAVVLAVIVIFRKKLWKCNGGISCGGDCKNCKERQK